MRQTLDDAGAPLSASGYAYTPFGVPQSGATPDSFSFTGELHSAGLAGCGAAWALAEELMDMLWQI